MVCAMNHRVNNFVSLLRDVYGCDVLRTLLEIEP
jgi:hypothetical protein